MIPDNEWTRLARYFAGECTPEEAEEIRRWLADDPAWQQVAGDLQPAWDAAATPSTSWDTPASWQRLAARVRVQERRAAVALVRSSPTGAGRRRVWWWPAAVAAAAVLAVGALRWRIAPSLFAWHDKAAAPREVRTAPTQRTAFRLPDGSGVVLAPGSLLRYDAASFGRPTRAITLEGRAYFTVIHDPRRPFLVRTARTVTEDMGTEFAITDYPNDATIEVAVASGSVAVRGSAAGRVPPAAVLRRNELVRFDTAGRATVWHDIDVTSRLAWTEGRLTFIDAPVPDVVKDLGRWYGIDVRLGDTSLARQRFTASYTTQPDSVIVRELATALGARVERHGAVILLFSVKGRS